MYALPLYARSVGEVPDIESAARAEETARENGVVESAQLGALRDVAGVSRLLGRWLAARPVELARLACDDARAMRAPEDLFAAARARRAAHAGGGDGLRAALRELRSFETARVLRRDLAGAPVVEVTAEVADIASGCFEMALADALAEGSAAHGPPKTDDGGTVVPFTVIGMGKLGGRELNYSSDVDVIYVYGTDKASTDSETANEFFSRVATRVTRALADVTEDGLAFRVDLDLRPEGKRGPIVNSLRSMEVYYESYGQTWERAAWLKAGGIAGDRALSDALLAGMEPFVYRRWLDFATLDAIREMKDRIDRSRATRGARVGAIEKGYDVKLGAGGIRELEFFIQALQLVNAGKRSEIRARGTLDGLARLGAAGFVKPEETAALTAAYEFLRRLEHRLQARELAQTHAMPTDDTELGVIAASMGFPREGSSLLSALAVHRARVADAFDGLFREKSRAAAALAGPEAALLADETVDDARGLALAEATQLFAEPRAAADAFARIRRGPLRSRQRESAFRYLARLAPVVFTELRASPDPDAAVVNLERFLAKIGGRTTLLALLAEHPPTAALLLRVFGASDHLSAAFIARPELLDLLFSAGTSQTRRRRRDLRPELREMVAVSGDLETRLDAVRRFRVAEYLRIGMADLWGNLPVLPIQTELTHLAEAVVERCLAIACEAEQADGAGLVVLGFGRLGAREMAYASDVDLVFLCDEFDDRHIRVAQRFLSALSAPTREGIAYRVDTRLRPSGSAGPLVVSRAAFRTYHHEHARTWERQAATRARPIAGDWKVWRAARHEFRELTFRPESDVKSLSREVGDMREAMEKQIGRGGASTYNLKTGRGGLVDVEFAAQYLQLAHGVDDPDLRSTHTLHALRRARNAGKLREENFDALAEGYLFLHHLENRLRIVTDRPVDDLPANGAAWDSLARRSRLAGGSGDRLRADLERITAAVRAAFLRVLNV